MLRSNKITDHLHQAREHAEARKYVPGKEGAQEIADVRRAVKELEEKKRALQERREAEEQRRREMSNGGSIRNARQQAKFEADELSEKQRIWKEKKQKEVAEMRLKEEIIKKVKADAANIKQEERRKFHLLLQERENRWKNEARKKQLAEEQRMAEVRRKLAEKAANKIMLPGLGPTNQYSVSYIRQRSKARRKMDVGSFYMEEEHELVGKLEAEYKQQRSQAGRKRERRRRTQKQKQRRGRGVASSKSDPGMIAREPFRPACIRRW